MTTQTYRYAFTAPGQTLTAPGGVFFFVKAASNDISITTRGTPSAPRIFENVGAGAKFGPIASDKRWQYLELVSATVQTVDLVVSDDAEFDLAGTVNVAGSVSMYEAPATTISTPAPDVITTGSALVVAASASRKRITIASLDTNTGTVYIQSTGAGAGRGTPVLPGMSHRIVGSYAFDVRNDSGASQTVMRTEES